MSELKPCPFCGSATEAVENKMMGSYPMRWGVICYECGTHQDTRATTRDAAVVAWNSRAAEYALEAENKALRKALRDCVNFMENTESELGITLSSADRARALLAKGEK